MSAACFDGLTALKVSLAGLVGCPKGIGHSPVTWNSPNCPGPCYLQGHCVYIVGWITPDLFWLAGLSCHLGSEPIGDPLPALSCLPLLALIRWLKRMARILPDHLGYIGGPLHANVLHWLLNWLIQTHTHTHMHTAAAVSIFKCLQTYKYDFFLHIGAFIAVVI